MKLKEVFNKAGEALKIDDRSFDAIENDEVEEYVPEFYISIEKLEKSSKWKMVDFLEEVFSQGLKGEDAFDDANIKTISQLKQLLFKQS